MASHSTDPKSVIHAKIVELARDLGNDARSLRNDQILPDTGLLDSPALLELIMFYEQTFGLDVDQEDLTLDNFGTIDSMAAYLARQPSGAWSTQSENRQAPARALPGDSSGKKHTKPGQS